MGFLSTLAKALKVFWAIGRAIMTSHSRCAKDSASCDTRFCLLREHRVLADVLLENFVAAALFSVSYFLNVVEEFRSGLSKPEGSVYHFGLSIGRAVIYRDYVIKACDTCDVTCEHVSRQGELFLSMCSRSQR